MGNRGREVPKHLVGIDLLRFFAAFVVMAFHLVYIVTFFKEMAHAASFGMISLPQLAPYTQWGWIGVQIFFVISGYVIALTAEKSTPWSFIVSRVTRLAPAVWICAPITFVALTFTLGMPSKSSLIHSIFFIPWKPWVDGAYWTLGIEIAFYSVVFFLVAIKRFDLLRYVAYVIGAASTIFWTWFHYINATKGFSAVAVESIVSNRALDLSLIHHGCFFAIGILIWLSVNKGSKNIPWLGIFIVGGILQILGEAAKYNGMGGPQFSPAIPVGVWLLATVFLIWSVGAPRFFDKLPKWVSPICRQLGLMTFPLYLLHRLVGASIMGALAKSGMSSEIAISITFFAVIFFSFVIAYSCEPPLQALTKKFLFRIQTKWLSWRTSTI